MGEEAVTSTGLGWPVSAVSDGLGLGWPVRPGPSSRLAASGTGPARPGRESGAGGANAGPPNVSRETVAVVDDTPIAAAAQDAVRRQRQLEEPLPAPAFTRVLTVANQKGGVGKTTSTVNLAAALALGGLRVLVIDLDPQGNASTALGIDHHEGVPSVYDVLVEDRPLREVIQSVTDVPRLWCAPATIDLAGAEIELVPRVARETRLGRALRRFLDEVPPGSRLDYVFIDCPPSLGLLTVNALAGAQEVLIPIQCEYYALEGLTQLLRNIEMVRSQLNPDIHVSTILLTMYDGRTRLAAGVADEVRAHFPDVVLDTAVPRSVRISEAPSYGQTVITYDQGSTGALSYLEAARELALRGVGSAGTPGMLGTSEAAGQRAQGQRTPDRTAEVRL